MFRVHGLRSALALLALAGAFLLPLGALAQQAPEVCDCDADGDIDKVDINIIANGRGQTATGPTDPRDPDRDNVITAADARTCTARCTLAKCASPSNRPPIADAGPDQTVFTDQQITLDGSDSTDPDGDPLTFRWSFVRKPAGSAATLTAATSVSPRFTPDVDGIYEIRLIVNDKQVDSAPDTVIITTGNAPPVADAGDDQTVVANQRVTLDGSGSSDINGDPLTYSWSFVSRPTGSNSTLSSSTAVMPTFTPDRAGIYRLRLIVNDGQVDSAADEVVIDTRTLPNEPPIADAGDDQTVDLNATVALDGSGSSDPDAGPSPLTFAWSMLTRPAGSTAVLSSTTAVGPTFRADRAGEYVLQLIVNDGADSSAPDTVRITTRNTRPVADAGDDQTANVNASVSLDGTGSFDNDGDPLTYSWSFTSRPNGSNATIANPVQPTTSFVADLAGLYVVQLVVNDGQFDSLPDTATITINVSNLNQISIEDLTVTEGNGGARSVTFTARRANPSGTSTVTFQTADGTATVADNDYTANSGTVTFGAGATTRPVGVSVVGDTRVEPDETFFVNLSNPSANATIVDPQAIGTIANDDAAALPVVSMATVDNSATETGPTAGTLRISRTGPLTTALTVNVTISGTATNGSDYQTLGTSVSMAASQASIDITITPIDDTAVESSETVVMTLAAAATYTIGTPNTATVTIEDNDTAALPTVTISAPDSTASEVGPNPGVIRVSRTGSTSAQLTVQTVRGGTATNALDYASVGNTIQIPAGAAFADVTFTTIDDAEVEGAETIIVTLSANAAYTIGTPSSAQIIIQDNDKPVITVTATDAAAAEAGLNPGSFSIVRTGPTNAPLNVSLSIGGNATNGVDYQTIAATFTIPTGQASGQLTITPIDDSIIESPESVIVGVAANNAYTIGSPSAGTVTIADNDVGALLEFGAATLLIGQNLQSSQYVRVSAGNAPAGGLAIRVVSSSPNVLLSATHTGTGAQTLNVTIDANQVTSPQFFVYSLAASGTASLTVEVVTTPNPGFSPGTPGAVTLHPAGYELLCQQGGCTSSSTGHGIETTAQAAPSLLYIQAQRLNDNTVTNRAGNQNVRGGTTITLPLSLSNANLGTFRAYNGGNPGAVITSLSIPAGEYYTYFYFDPNDASSGSGTINFTKPAGAGTPLAGAGPYAQSMPVAVAGATVIRFQTPAQTVGRDLQVNNALILGAPAPAGGLSLRLSSNSANVLLSSSPTAAGAQTLDIIVPAGNTGSPAFTVQSLSATGTTDVSVQVLTTPNPGFAGGTPLAVTHAPSGYQLFCYSGPGTCAFDTPNNRDALTTVNTNASKLMYIEAYYLNPANPTNNIVGAQNVRGGISVTMALSLTNTSIGVLRDYPSQGNVISAITIPGGTYFAYFYFDPNNASTGGNGVINYTKPATAGTPTAGGTPRRQSMSVVVTQ